jgi:formate dehydrogenase major subunit
MQQAAVDNKHRREFPLILTSGRLVEYEGGGEETRSNKWLAELQQDMFVEINPADAERSRHQRRRWVWVDGSRGRLAARSRRWSPSASAGASPSCRSTSPAGSRARTSAQVPEGTDPIVLGESVNTAPPTATTR